MGRIDLFHKNFIDSPRSVKASISRALTDVHIQDWSQKMISLSRGKSYNYLKQDLSFENYLINLDKKKHLPLSKCRTGIHRLHVETGR